MGKARLLSSKNLLTEVSCFYHRRETKLITIELRGFKLLAASPRPPAAAQTPQTLLKWLRQFCVISNGCLGAIPTELVLTVKMARVFSECFYLLEICFALKLLLLEKFGYQPSDDASGCLQKKKRGCRNYIWAQPSPTADSTVISSNGENMYLRIWCL